LNKLLADRRSSIPAAKVEARVREVVEREFAPTPGLTVVSFPDRSSDISDQPALTLLVMPPEYPASDPVSRSRIEQMTREHGTANRTFKSALIWCAAENAGALMEDARKLMAWEAIRDEERDHLDASQQRQLEENVPKAARDLKERVWQTYRHVLLLAKDSRLRDIDLGRSHSSSAATLAQLVLIRLKSDGEIEESVGAGFLMRNWPPALTEWSTKKVRNDFFASPQFPRLLNGDVLKETIANGARDRLLAYVGKVDGGLYEPFYFGARPDSVELTDDLFIITRETAEAYLSACNAQAVEKARTESDQSTPAPDDEATHVPPVVYPEKGPDGPGGTPGTTADTNRNGEYGQPPAPLPSHGIRWHGDVPAQKWTTFYTKVLSRFARESGVELRLQAIFEVDGDVPSHKLEETRAALRELGLRDDVCSEWQSEPEQNRQGSE